MKISDLEKMLAKYKERFGDDEIAFYTWGGVNGLVDLKLTEIHDGYPTHGGCMTRECVIRLRAPE